MTDNKFWQLTQDKLAGTGLAGLGIRAPFTIPSGIVTTAPSVISAIAKLPEIGFLTTKTLSLHSRAGYREPVIHEYYPGCFVNAVGLANPGAEVFLRTMQALLPLHENKPLVVSIMGENPQEFLDCALVLDPIADAFELNLSCPHVKGAGQSIGSDPETVSEIIRSIKSRTRKPVIPKLSPNLGDIAGMAVLCRDSGADALSLINTVGPGIALDREGNPILSNVLGGLSGSGILPIGIKSVREASRAVDLPIIASGGIGSADDVRSYASVGASLFAIGSSLAGMSTPQLANFFERLMDSLNGGQQNSSRGSVRSEKRMDYMKTQVIENSGLGAGIFKLVLEQGPACNPGMYFFLRLPEAGEKPFSPAWDTEPVYLVRKVGTFTEALEKLQSGDSIYMRGPYGNGFEQPWPHESVVLVGGGTGTAPILMAARRWPNAVFRAFFGFSEQVNDSFHKEMLQFVPSANIIYDRPNEIGKVVRSLAEDACSHREEYSRSRVYVCGPAAMMNAVYAVLDGIVPPQRICIAREDIMKCGVGLCGTCATEQGFRSCVDGPVETRA